MSEVPRGLPRPTRRNGMPVPYNAMDEAHLGVLDSTRQFEIWSYAICQTCGLPLDEFCLAVEQTLITTGELPDILDNGCLHDECLRLALAWCPHLRSRHLEIWELRSELIVRVDQFQLLLKIPRSAINVTERYRHLFPVEGQNGGHAPARGE